MDVLKHCCVFFTMVFGVSQSQDFVVTSGPFEMIYHEAHNLLLTVHEGACYFASVDSSIMHSQSRSSIVEMVKAVITDSSAGNTGNRHFTTLEEMRDAFTDRLATFHCLQRDIYIIYVDSLTCDFEALSLCGWTQGTAGIFDMQWRLHQGETPTTLTGPRNDHTTGTSQGTYLYLETNEGSAGNTATLQSPLVYHAQSGLCFRFWYDMYGTNIDTLTVVAQEDQQPDNNLTLWSLHGNQGQGWKMAEVSVPANLAWNDSLRVLIQASRGSGIRGDIAIDDVSSSLGICVADHFTCSFEHDMCGWSNTVVNDDRDWVRRTGDSSSSGFGPTHADHNIHPNNSYYMFVDGVAYPGDKASLQSPRVRLKEPVCLVFYYYISGDSTELDVILRRVEGRTISDHVIWSKGGDQGSAWHKATVTVTAPAPDLDIQVLFQATRGLTLESTAAVDAVAGFSGTCSQLPNTLTPSHNAMLIG